MKNESHLQIRNLMWLDIKGSDLKMRELGVHIYAQRVEEFYKVIDGVCDIYSVQMVDTLGDGISLSSVDLPIDSLVKFFLAAQEEVKNRFDWVIKAGVHSGQSCMKQVILSSGMRIPLLTGAINEAYRLESLCNLSEADLLMSPEAYAELESENLRSLFVRSNGKFKRKNSYFPVVYKYIKAY